MMSVNHDRINLCICFLSDESIFESRAAEEGEEGATASKAATRSCSS